MKLKYLIALILIGSLFSCNKEDDVNNSTGSTNNYDPDGNNNEPIVPAGLHIQAIIDNQPWSVEAGQVNTDLYSDNQKSYNGNNTEVIINYRSGFIKSFYAGEQDTLLISFSKNTHPTNSYYQTDLLFYSDFTTGSKTYYSTTNSENVGVEIIYKDKNNVVWTSSTGSQTSSSFQVTNSLSKTDGNGFPYQEVTGNFSCVVYSQTAPVQAKFISNAIFRLNYEKP